MGKPTLNQSQNVIVIPKFLSNKAAICVFGGEPTNVAIPPILELYAIESNNKIIQILEKYSELLEIINQNPLLNFESKGILSKCSSSLSILTINDEKEDLIYANLETEPKYKEPEYTEQEPEYTEQEPEYTESVHSESEYTDLIDECYDALPCSNSKKATAFNRIFKWN